VSTTETDPALDPDPATDPTEAVVASRPDRIVDAALVAAATLVVVAGIAPQAVFTDVLPWRTDLTGHVVVPWLDRQDLTAILPGAWSDAMFSGFPLNQLYPWLPSFVAALLSFVMPLAIAFKTTVVAPLVALPWAAWRAGTWAGLPRPVPAMLSVAMLPFVYDTSCTSCGGTINAAILGEYSFSWGLLFAVLSLGAVARLARTGRGRIVTALLVAATAVSHPLPTLWLVVGIGALAIGAEVWAGRRRRRAFLVAAGLAGLMAANWWIPFLARRDWMPLLGFPRREEYALWLLPASPAWEAAIVVLAVAGVVWAARHRSWFVIAIAVQTAVAGAAFWRLPEGGQLYNLRVLPFWYYGRWVLAAVGFVWLVSVVMARVRRDRTAPDDPRVAPLVGLLASALVIGSTWGWWGVVKPATDTAEGTASVLGVEVEITRQSTAPALVLGGPDTSLAKTVNTTLESVLADVARARGCGRLAWDETLDPAESTSEDAVEIGQLPWQSPIWTDGCITPVTGVLVDSSATAPTALMTQDLVSTEGARVMPSVPDLNVNLAAGVDRMRTMGVRYYLTRGGPLAQEAAATPGLAEIATAGPLTVWEVEGFGLVAPLRNQPAVVEPRLDDSEWDNLSTAYFLSPAFDITPLVQDGPSDWARVGLSVLPPDAPLDEVTVSDVAASPDTIRFDVDVTGIPVVVRVSDYPAWSVGGADGPYRATPNFLVVVPTSETVVLTRARTAIDGLAVVLGALGFGIAVGMVVYAVLDRRRIARAAAEPDEAWDDDLGDGLGDRDADIDGGGVSNDAHSPSR
jgi:hypothetical protein